MQDIQEPPSPQVQLRIAQRQGTPTEETQHQCSAKESWARTHDDTKDQEEGEGIFSREAQVSIIHHPFCDNPFYT
jgi:hypothetical protein